MRFQVESNNTGAFITSVDRHWGPFDDRTAAMTLVDFYETGRATKIPSEGTRPSDLKPWVPRVYAWHYVDRPADLDSLLVEDPLPPFVVRWIRQGLGLTQSQLAKRLGLGSRRTLQNYELGSRPCSGPTRLVLIQFSRET